MARLCMFCGQNKRSREHVWPRWLSKALPSGVPTDFQSMSYDRANNLIGTRPFQVRHDIEEKVRVPCEQCNNGWMSVLENEVKPVLTPMMRNEPVNLDRHDMDVLATWAVKTAFMAQ